MRNLAELNEWLRKYCDQSPDAIIVFRDGEPIFSNNLAKGLQKSTGLSIDYLQQVAHNAWHQHRANDCANCKINGRLDRVTVPVTSHLPSGKKLHFSLIYQLLDPLNKITALTVQNSEQQRRIDKVAQQQRLNQYVNRAHEKERQRISQDLHDSIAQGIYSAMMGVRRLKNQQLTPAEVGEISQSLEIQLAETLSEIKGMALDIRPSVLDSFGLVSAIKALAKRQQANTGVTIHVVANTKPKELSTDVQNVLYRICQEAMSNALRHANPSEIDVILTNHDHFVKLEVLDDGKGFQVNQHQGFNGHSLGLMNMRERVQSLNGAFNIHSHVGVGTTVTAQFPLRRLVRNR